MKKLNKRTTISLFFAIIVLAVVYLAWPSPKVAAPQSNHPNSSGQTSPSAASFNKSMYSLSQPASLWVIVNKQHPLDPISYAPNDLVVPNVPLRVPGNDSMQMRQAAANALERMFAAAKTAGLDLQLSSGYRSYTYQVNLYNSYVKADGQAQADKESARPGYSEHQTGMAVDIEPASRKCELQTCFKDTPEGIWLVANAYKYGFLLRYPADKVAVTGYEYEPWHFRYLGTELSQELYDKNVRTLEEFFGVPGGVNY